jgi:hypothetical protein
MKTSPQNHKEIFKIVVLTTMILLGTWLIATRWVAAPPNTLWLVLTMGGFFLSFFCLIFTSIVSGSGYAFRWVTPILFIGTLMVVSEWTWVKWFGLTALWLFPTSLSLGLIIAWFRGHNVNSPEYKLKTDQLLDTLNKKQEKETPSS